MREVHMVGDRRNLKDRRFGIERRQSSMPTKLERRMGGERRTIDNWRSGLDRRRYSTSITTM